MNEQNMNKRPVSITILLVLSFINACWNIISSLVMRISIPHVSEMMQNGQIDEMMESFSTMISEEQRQMMLEGMKMLSQIDSRYWLFMALLFVGSLVGVIRMFKGNKTGLHIYAISQLLLLINASFYLYPKQPQSNFLSELILTVLFILMYYLYFKRMEILENPPQNPDQP